MVTIGYNVLVRERETHASKPHITLSELYKTEKEAKDYVNKKIDEFLVEHPNIVRSDNETFSTVWLDDKDSEWSVVIRITKDYSM